MRKSWPIAAVILIALGMLAGCDSGTTSNKTATPSAGTPAKSGTVEKSDEPVQNTGRTAFQRLYATARLWAPDAKPVRLQSTPTTDDSGQGGKSSIWRATFASPSKRAIKTYTWSGSHADGAPEFGISPSPEDTYNPSNTSTPTFEIAYLHVDSGEAYAEAQKHGGLKLTAKNPKQPVVYVLDWDPRKNELLWHVIYGPDANKATQRVAVSATSGAFARVER